MSNYVVIRRSHRVKHSWWDSNDSWLAKVVTSCGLRREQTVLAGDPEENLCERCYPYGPPLIVLIKTPAQLRAFSGHQP